MRIGLLAQLLSFGDDYRQAGVSRYIEQLLRYLPKVLSPADQLHAYTSTRSSGTSTISEFPDSIEWHWTSWPTGRVPVRILWEQLAAPIQTRGASIDLLHGPVNVLPVAARTPAVVTIHDLAFLAYPHQYPRLQQRYLRLMTGTSARRALKVITVSNYTRTDVVERLGIPDEKVVAVPNGVDANFYPRSGTPELDEFRRTRALPEQFLLFVGTLQPRKNLIGLLRAFATLDPQSRIPLYIVGAPGWMYEEIYSTMRQLGIAGEVHFPGYSASDSLPLWYSAATAFVYPSFYEGFGLPVLESMACGTPVVSSNRSSLPEVVGDAGLLASPDNTEELAGAITKILGDNALREDLSNRARQQAAEFTWERTARETAAVYREVMNES